MQVGYEQVMSERDIVKMLFKHKDSIKAARRFIDWLKSKCGVFSRSEMNQFSARYSADLNGAINIAKRFAEQCLADGASLAMPVNSPRVK